MKKPITVVGTIIGLVTLGLGIAGLFSAAIPAVPFLFVAVLCFVHFSPPFVALLSGRPIMNSFFDDYIKERSMTSRNKKRTLLLGTAICAAFFFLFETWVGKIIAVLALGAMWYYVFFCLWTKIEDGHGCPGGVSCPDDDGTSGGANDGSSGGAPAAE